MTESDFSRTYPLLNVSDYIFHFPTLSCCLCWEFQLWVINSSIAFCCITTTFPFEQFHYYFQSYCRLLIVVTCILCCTRYFHGSVMLFIAAINIDLKCLQLIQSSTFNIQVTIVYKSTDRTKHGISQTFRLRLKYVFVIFYFVNEPESSQLDIKLMYLIFSLHKNTSEV